MELIDDDFRSQPYETFSAFSEHAIDREHCELYVNWEMLPSLRYLHLYNWNILKDKPIQGTLLKTIILDDVRSEGQLLGKKSCPNLKKIDIRSSCVNSSILKNIQDNIGSLEILKVCGVGIVEKSSEIGYMDSCERLIPNMIGPDVFTHLKVFHIVGSNLITFLPKSKDRKWRIVNLSFLERICFEKIYEIGVELAHLPRLTSFTIINKDEPKLSNKKNSMFTTFDHLSYIRTRSLSDTEFIKEINMVVDFDEGVGVNTLKEFVIERLTKTHISLKLWKDLFTVYRTSLEVLHVHIEQDGWLAPHPFTLADLYFEDNGLESRLESVNSGFDEKVSVVNFPELRDFHLRYYDKKRITDIQAIQNCPRLKKLNIYFESITSPFQKKTDLSINFTKLGDLEEVSLHNVYIWFFDLENPETTPMNLKGHIVTDTFQTILSQIQMLSSIRRIYLSGNKEIHEKSTKKKRLSRFFDEEEVVKKTFLKVDRFNHLPLNLEYLVLEYFDHTSISNQPNLKELYVSGAIDFLSISNPSLEKIQVQYVVDRMVIKDNRILKSFHSSWKYPKKLEFVGNNPEIETLYLGCEIISKIDNMKSLKSLHLNGTRNVKIYNRTFPVLEEIEMRNSIHSIDIFGINTLKSLKWDFNSKKFESGINFKIKNCSNLEIIDLHQFLSGREKKSSNDNKPSNLEFENLLSCSSLKLGSGFSGFSEFKVMNTPIKKLKITIGEIYSHRKEFIICGRNFPVLEELFVTCNFYLSKDNEYVMWIECISNLSRLREISLRGMDEFLKIKKPWVKKVEFIDFENVRVVEKTKRDDITCINSFLEYAEVLKKKEGIVIDME